jgi:hypothetical protein
MCIYQIKVPEEQYTEAFSKFMREELLPSAAGPTMPTRVGRFDGARLLEHTTDRSERSGADNAPEFFLFRYWDGVGDPICPDDAIASDKVLRKLESFGARLKLLGAYLDHGEQKAEL